MRDVAEIHRQQTRMMIDLWERETRARTLFGEADRVRYGTVQCGRGSAGRLGAARYYSPGFPSPWSRPLGADLAG